MVFHMVGLGFRDVRQGQLRPLIPDNRTYSLVEVHNSLYGLF